MQDPRVTPTADEMDRRRVILKDGRYLFFYTFPERDPAAPVEVSRGEEGASSEAERIV
jgi:hypothetical protein